MSTALIWDERFFWHEFGDYRSLLGDHAWLQPGSFAETAENNVICGPGSRSGVAMYISL